MALPVGAAAAAIGAGGQITGGFLNAATTLYTNRRQEKFSERMYNLQRDDALEFWRMQNEFNDPLNQMVRAKRAGINPHSLYGNGSIANTAANIQTPDVQPVQYKNPDLGGYLAAAFNTLSQYQDFQIRGAQYDILKQQADNLALQNQGLEFKNQILGLDYSDKSKMLPTRQATELARLDQIKANTSFTLNQQQLNTIKNTSDLRVAMSQLLSMEEQRAKSREERAQIQQAVRLLRQDETLKGIQINLSKLGIQPGSPAWMNVVGTFFNLLMQR